MSSKHGVLGLDDRAAKVCTLTLSVTSCRAAYWSSHLPLALSLVRMQSFCVLLFARGVSQRILDIVSPVPRKGPCTDILGDGPRRE